MIIKYFHDNYYEYILSKENSLFIASDEKLLNSIVMPSLLYLCYGQTRV